MGDGRISLITSSCSPTPPGTPHRGLAEAYPLLVDYVDRRRFEDVARQAQRFATSCPHRRR